MGNNRIKGHHISQVHGLPVDEKFDFFDVNLRFDSPMYIDPFLIKNSRVPEEAKLFDRFGTFFKYAYSKSLILSNDSSGRDELKRLLTFHEPKNICMGYTEGSNEGHGPSLTQKLMTFFIENTAKRFVTETDAFPDKKYNPTSMQVFTDGVGPDGISDISANLLMDYLIDYTTSQAEKWGIPLEDDMVLNVDGFDFDQMEHKPGGLYRLPENPFKPGEAVVFVPKRWLRALDDTRDNTISQVRAILRDDPLLAARFGTLLTKSIAETDIEEIRQVFKEDSSVHYRYLIVLERERNEPYDFKLDPQNILSDKTYSDYFSELEPPELKDCNDLKLLVERLIDEFDKDFALRDGWRDAWKTTATPTGKISWRVKTEPAIGRKFRSMGYMLFSLYDDVTFIPEMSTGNGLVDFAVVYNSCKIVIELKLLKNNADTGSPSMPAYLHGIQRQLPAYAELINAKHAYYITGQHYNGQAHKTDHTYRVLEIETERPNAESELKKKISTFGTLNYKNVKMVPRPSASKE